ncbi:FecR domain-containing protein [Candidatus Woesearchaeota archaeon]|nr:FecR domain-containing protein [Candidatus Woesearchaeota archaeon]
MRTGIALFILLALVVGCAPAGQDNASVASLENVAGTVTVNGKDTTGAALYVGDVIATGADAKAQVVFSDSAVLRLDANTEITIKGTTDTNVAVFQSSGQTWSRVLHLSGISDYEIETATTTASVRGTGFKVKVNKDDTEVAVGEGEVEVSTKKDGKVLKR